MNKLQTSLSFSAVVVAGALFALPALTSAANASVTSNLMNCKYNSKQKTISCCQQVIRSKQLPQWFQNAGGSCSAVVKCVGGGGNQNNITFIATPRTRKCYVYIPNEVDRDGGRVRETPQRGRLQ
jgi:hypothetical protein